MNHCAVVFPGQGSQSLNMLAAFSEHVGLVEHYTQRASSVLGYNLAELIEKGPEEKLNQTEYTQPALLVAGVIAWEIWKKNISEKPAFFAGHSLGEYTALTCAKSITFEDAVRLVQARGQYMQAAVPVGEGAMAAIVGLDETTVATVCASVAHSDDLSPANFNSIGQVVIAGKREAVEAAILAAKEAGAKMALMLPMSVPSHCHLMLPAAKRLEKTLNTITFQAPEIPVINNVDVTIETSSETIKEALVRQLYSPVRWVETIQNMRLRGVSTIVECGPGKVLAGLIKRIDKEIVIQPLMENKA